MPDFSLGALQWTGRVPVCHPLKKLKTVVETAFPLPTKMANVLGIGNLVEAPGGHPVADGHITPFPQRVIGEGVGFEVGPDLPVRPFKNRQKFPTGILAAENLLLLTVL